MSSQSEKEGRPDRIASQEFLPRANKVSFELQILFSNKNETKNTKRDSINSLLFQFIINSNTLSWKVRFSFFFCQAYLEGICTVMAFSVNHFSYENSF
jgi:hypothetical protein